MSSYQSDNRLHGLGIQHGSPQSYHHHNSPSGSPQRQQPNTGSPQRSGTRSSAPSRAPTTPTRDSLHSQYQYEQPQYQHHSQQPPPQQPQFALRPTHSTRGYSLPPPAPPPFAPATSSPLKPRADNTAAFGYTPMYSEPPDEYRNENSARKSASSNSGHGHQVRPSKSTEMLKRLSCSAIDDKRGTYRHISDDEEDDDPEERLRLPASNRHHSNNSPRSSGSQATGLRGPAPPDNSPWTNGKERLPRSFPNPPTVPSPGGHQSPPSSSSDHFHSANEDHTYSSSSGHSSAAQPASSQPGHASPHRNGPHAAEAAPRRTQRPKSDMFLMRKHSKNEALLGVETGGMVAMDDDYHITTARPSGAMSMPKPSVRPQPPSTAHPQYPHIPQAADGMSQRSDQSLSQSDASQMSSQQQHHLTHPASQESFMTNSTNRIRHTRSYSDGEGLAALARQGTLLHPGSSEARAAQELDLMLGRPRTRRLSGNRLLPAPEADKKSKDKVRLEASKKSQARVQLDVVIERECVIEGGELRGRLEVIVRGGKKNKDLRVGAGKIRVLGFEELPGGGANTRHIFYQHQYLIPAFEESRNGPTTSLFADAPDEEGFCLAKEGTHAIPFALPLPLDGGAKGGYTSPTGKGPNVRYVVVGSVKLHIPKSGKRAIAHFYRPVVVLPYISPSAVLVPSPSPIVAHHQSGLGWNMIGEKGMVTMQVALGRRTWVAGQRVWCEITVRNDSKKKVNKCTLAILQTVNTYGLPGKNRNPHVPIHVERKKVAEEITEADFMEVGSGHITSRSWWTGLEPQESNRWDMSVPIPTGMVSVPRSRFVEVTYTLRVTLNNTIYVDMPLDLINFLSIDPPPMPSDVRRRRRVLSQMRLSAPPEPQMEPHLVHASVNPRHRAVATAGALNDESPTLGRDGGPPGQGYTTQQLRGESPNKMSGARTSPTTLNIDTLMEQGRARAKGQNEVGDELNPRAVSPGSMYSTVGNKGKFVGRHCDHDRADCQLCSGEAERREGRSHMLEVIQNDDARSNISHDSRLTVDDGCSYAPAEAPVERSSFEIGASGPNSVSDHDEEDTFDDAATETDRTPQASPQVSPDKQTFQLPLMSHPRDAFLAHISEEEEPLEDDMLDDIMSHGHDGGHIQMQGGDDGGEDLYDEPHYATSDSAPRTPHDTPSRRSLEDRLALACGPGLRPPPRRPSGERPKSVDYTEPIDIDSMSLSAMSLHDHDDGYDGDSNSTLGRSSPSKRGKPRHAHSASLPSWAVSDIAPPMLPSLGSARDIRWGGTLTGRTVSGRSMMPAFDDEMGSPKIPFEPRNLRAASPTKRLASPMKSRSASPLKQRPASPLKQRPSSPIKQRPSPPAKLPHAHESRNLAAMSSPGGSLVRDHQSFDLAANAAESSASSDDSGDLPPPSRATVRSYSPASTGSYHTASAKQSMDGLSPIRTGFAEDNSSDDTMASRGKPVFQTPLPSSPLGRPQRASLDVPDRFKPRERVVSGESLESVSTTMSLSSTHESVVLPAVKARVAQIETREEALRRFTVNRNTGLGPPSPGPSMRDLPLSPVSTGSTATAQPSKRKSYTAALAPRPASTHEGTSPVSANFSFSGRSTGSRWSSDERSGDDRSGSDYSRSEYSDQTLNDLRTPPTSTFVHHSGQTRIGLAPEALSGTAFAHGPGSPTSTISHAHHSLVGGWETIGDVGKMRSVSPDKQARLLRSASNASTSTTATDVDRALAEAHSPSVTPRGPRSLNRDRAPSPLPFPPPSSTKFAAAPAFTPSPALTPCKAPSPNLMLRSETATLENASVGSDHHDTSDLDPRSETSSDYGSTGWSGSNVRLPPVRMMGPRPM